MIHITTISKLPQTPAVYALYGGNGSHRYVAYLGVASKLKNRINQHLVRKDSSVATGTSAVALNPEHVTAVDWWHHPSFDGQVQLEAAETIATELMDPALRGRNRIREGAQALLQDDSFVGAMKALFQRAPTGRLELPSLTQALDRIANLEERVTALEGKLKR